MSRAPLPLAAHERLIFALDVPSHDEAIAWVDRLGDSVAFYKIGMELLPPASTSMCSMRWPSATSACSWILNSSTFPPPWPAPSVAWHSGR